MPLNLKYRINLIIFVICFVWIPAAFGASPATFTGQINADDINVRVDATAGSKLICTLSKGELAEVVSEAYDWYKIRLPKEAPSYVKGELVECITSEAVPNQGKCASGKVIKDRINVRLAPSESSWILGKADKLTVVNILDRESGWYKIQPIYKSYGWVNKKFVNREILLPVPEPKKEEVPVVPVKELVAPVKAIQPLDILVLEGTVSPYGIVLWRQATHKLVTSDGKIYFLKGNRKSLDSLNYHKIKVTGKLISPAESKNPIIQVNIIEALN